MKYCLPTIVLRVWLGVLLLAGTGSCTLYHKVFHPYRLPTPKPSPEYLAQQKKKKADEKLRNDLAKASASERKKSGSSPVEAATDISTPSLGSATATTSDAEPRVLPEKSTVRYDKHGLMKKPKLKRRQLPKYGPPHRPIQSIRNFFRYGFHAKPNYDPDHRPAPKQPAEPAPEPDAAPDGKP